jgi:hypothetical protein
VAVLRSDMASRIVRFVMSKPCKLFLENVCYGRNERRNESGFDDASDTTAEVSDREFLSNIISFLYHLACI